MIFENSSPKVNFRRNIRNSTKCSVKCGSRFLLVPSRLSEARRRGALGVMGRRKEGRRLADSVFKMADELMADGREILNLENRPFHRAYLSGKVPCPHVQCRTELGRTFFEQAGLVQHFTAKHGGMRSDEKSEEMRGDCLY